MATQFRIGFDIGGSFVKAVKLDSYGNHVSSFYQAHKGDVADTCQAALEAVQYQKDCAIAVTGAFASGFSDEYSITMLDIVKCQIKSIHSHCPQARYIIDVGGTSASLIALDEQGNFQNYAINSLCAAGTGAFLDEQAQRLGISHEDMAKHKTDEQPPSIATRCSVFAKSDLIHRQQEGYSIPAMWSGLCRGMTKTLLSTLLKGKPLDAQAAVIGGVACNDDMIYWLNELTNNMICIPEQPHFIAATGAALFAESTAMKHISYPIIFEADNVQSQDVYDWPLSLEKSNYPSFDAYESYLDDDLNEVRIMEDLSLRSSLSAYLGIDVGSTSTKLAVVDSNDHVVIDIYRRTSGNPIEATKLLFRALRKIEHNKNISLCILGVGTTGSGRKMVGQVIGADAIINEISAHVTGASYVDPSVDTIFEIGGQDSKYMHVVDGNIRDANMNYVCAAGTGSFIEEQAKKLGFEIDEVGDAVSDCIPPRATDRCTVFMEQDITRIIRLGATPQEAMASVMVSVVKNYLNKVVGNRYYNREKIFFQGATARNPGLVAAFERVLGVEVVVSPYCHVMGAYGVAQLTKQMMAKTQQSSSFFGLNLDQKEITLSKEVCNLCANDCQITIAHIEGQKSAPSWGYMCGRDPDEQRVKKNDHERALLLRKKLWREMGNGIQVPKDAPVVGIPQALTTYTYYPLWQRFFNELGYRVQLSGVTGNAQRELGTNLTGAEFCFPAKVSMGHVADLVIKQGVDYVFWPHMLAEERHEHASTCMFCPYVEGAPSFAKIALELNGYHVNHLLSPAIDMRETPIEIAKSIWDATNGYLSASKGEIKQAWIHALACQREFEQRCKEEGQKLVAQARKNNQTILVLVGRPYNNFDTGINLQIPKKVSEYGYVVLPMDFLGADLSLLGETYQNMFWYYGQKILATLQYVSQQDDMAAIYLTNFNCGPDSFLLSYAEEVMGKKPFLALELDEHGADAGYMTRIEAFLDVLSRTGTASAGKKKIAKSTASIKNRTVWMPPMNPQAAEFFAAAFRRYGYDSKALPTEDKQAFDLGRSITRGSECLPTALTIGALMKQIGNEQDLSKHAFFMPTSQGPCRFGQYCTLFEQVLKNSGMGDIAILSPSSINSYQGIEEGLRRLLWPAMLASDILIKASCKVRPYEIHEGDTNEWLNEQTNAIANIIETGGSVKQAIRHAIALAEKIPVRKENKPLVGVIGEIYVRSNSYANEDVIGAIESFGGEAWLTPLSEWVMYTSANSTISILNKGINTFGKWLTYLKNIYITYNEHSMHKAAGTFLDDRVEPNINEILKTGEKYIPLKFTGETILTIGRAIMFAKQGAAMVVNCAPFGCMPGSISTAIFQKVIPQVQMPIVNMFYDGHGEQNQRLAVFLANAMGAEPASHEFIMRAEGESKHLEVNEEMKIQKDRQEKQDHSMLRD